MKKPLKIAIIVAPVLAIAGIGTAFALNPPAAQEHKEPVVSVTQETKDVDTTEPIAPVTEAPPAPQAPTPSTPAEPTPTPTPAPIYGEDPERPGWFRVFDINAVLEAADVKETDKEYQIKLLLPGWPYKADGSAGVNICGANPTTKMSTMGADYATNPITQVRWCNEYAVKRYGTTQHAYEIKQEFGQY